MPQGSSPRIAIDARYTQSELSGIGRVCLNLVTAGLGAGLDPTLTFLIQGSRRPPPIPIPESATIPVSYGPYGLRNQLCLPRVLRRHRIDALICADAFAPLRTRSKTVIIVHDLIPYRFRQALRVKLKVRLLPVWMSWLWMQARRADLLVTVSEFARAEFEGVLGVDPEKICVVHPGVVRPPAIPTGPARIEGEPLVLYVGRYDPHKNLIGLMRAFELVLRQMDGKVRLLLVGRTDPRFSEPLSLAEKLGIRDRIAVLGHVSEERLDQLYRRAAVLVLPSLYEGFGLTVLEAMARGTPIVASNRTGIPEVAGDGALLVDPEDTAAMADAICGVLTDEVLRRKLRERGLARAAALDADRQGRRLIDRVAALVRSHG